VLDGEKAKAAVCREMNKPVVVEEIEIESPGRDQVMIKLSACGVCHSDLSATNGTIKFPLPLIIGHEGAGVVVEVGESVTDLAVGDHVISSFVTMRQVSVLTGDDLTSAIGPPTHYSRFPTGRCSA
jgi:Zn-dependent alcohol dehydrogenase